jgi:hypothetical protein
MFAWSMGRRGHCLTCDEDKYKQRGWVYCGISIDADATGVGIPASYQSQILLFWYSLLPEKV